MLRRHLAGAASAAATAARTAGQGTGGATTTCHNPRWASCSKTSLRQIAQKAAQEAGEASKGGSGWFKDFAESKLRLLVAAGLGIILLNAGASAASTYYYQKTVLDTLIRGVLPPAQTPPVLPRTEMRQKVHELLRPKEPSTFYHVVTGPPGCGKSTLLREACRAVGGGVGYVDVSPVFDVDWGRDLGNAFNFRFQDHMTRINIVSKPVLGTQYEDPRSSHPLASLRQSAEALHDAAAEYRDKTGRPFVLVIDSADRLSGGENGERVLGAMLAYARDWAQEGIITTVFIAHEWDTVEKLTGDHPAQSRAAPVLRVPDICQQEAVEYLRHLGVQGKQAEQCAGLVGGSLLLLQRCAGMSKAGTPFPEIKQQLFELIEMAYNAAGLVDQTPHREGGLAVVEALLGSKDGVISAAEWRENVPDREHQLALLSKGVLRFDGRKVHFSSNLAAAFAAEQLYLRLPRSVQEKHKHLKRFL